MHHEGGRTPHGRKRRAQEELANDQRLVKRFNLLDLGESLASEISGRVIELSDCCFTGQDGKLRTSPDIQRGAKGRHDDEDSMQLDDTKDKVYIHNLDQELKAVDEDEEKLIFLPDIERKLNKIPRSVLRGHTEPLANNEMVLYSIPSSLTVPEGQDNVRKAIIESRDRARHRQAEEAKLIQQGIAAAPTLSNESWHEDPGNAVPTEGNEDAMDLG